MEIQIIQPDQYVAALEVMNTIVQELWGIPLDHVREVDSLADLDDIKGYYLDSGGIFFVVLDKGQVVGSGGIHPIDKTTCELKRVWLLPPYRGKGLGKQLTKMLIAPRSIRDFSAWCWKWQLQRSSDRLSRFTRSWVSTKSKSTKRKASARWQWKWSCADRIRADTEKAGCLIYKECHTACLCKKSTTDYTAVFWLTTLIDFELAYFTMRVSE